MEKRRNRRKLIPVLLLMSLMFFIPVSVQAADISVTQTEVCLPDINVYIRGAEDVSYSKEDVKAAIKETDTDLTVQSVDTFSETGRGIFYRILLDKSTSLTETQFENMKDSVIALAENKREEDRISVVTFGKNVETILDGGEDLSEIKKKVSAVKREKGTHLYEAINKMSEQVEQFRESEREEGKSCDQFTRNVGIIFTDWQEVKDQGGATSRTECLTRLQKTGTPLFGYCADTAKVSLQDDMGEFLRNTGGSFSVYDGTKKKEAMKSFHKKCLQETVVVLSSSSKVTYDTEKTIEVSAGEDSGQKGHVYLNAAEKDEEAPTITSVEQSGKDARTVIVTFSEDVLGGDNKSNYSIKRNGKRDYTVSEASYTAKDGDYQAKLILNDRLEKGSYEVSTVNITDNTDEKNALTESWSGDLNGEGSLKAFYTRLGKFWAVILAAAVLLIIGILYYIIHKRRGIMLVEDKMVFGEDMIDKKHIKSDSSSTKNVMLLISGVSSDTKKMPLQIHGSAIVGKASYCDIYFDDISMSRQHFCFSVENGKLYVEDLESTNGTEVDGEMAAPHEKKELHSGSQIMAGSITFDVRW